MKKKPKILVTNDDGIYSSGIYALWEAVSQLGSVSVVAPSTEKSAVSHAITIDNLLRTKYIERSGGFKGWAVTGTPADCTKLAIKEILDHKPDLIVSGINRGSNLGNNILYSGTVSAATEGAIFNIPSIAISLDSYKIDDWNGAQIAVGKIAENVLKYGLPKGTLLNVNVPYCNPSDVKGIKVTRQGNQYFKDEYNDASRRILSENLWRGFTNFSISLSPSYPTFKQYSLVRNLLFSKSGYYCFFAHTGSRHWKTFGLKNSLGNYDIKIFERLHLSRDRAGFEGQRCLSKICPTSTLKVLCKLSANDAGKTREREAMVSWRI